MNDTTAAAIAIAAEFIRTREAVPVVVDGRAARVVGANPTHRFGAQWGADLWLDDGRAVCVSPASRVLVERA